MSSEVETSRFSFQSRNQGFLQPGLISNAVWKGFPLRDVLDRAVPLSGAARVRFHGVDNYMNGAELPDRHGYPLRLIVPGYLVGVMKSGPQPYA
jgi:DMSO/TMAO reductase YedYZ molybdopterin-dependent catalytic subunit